MSLMNEEKEDEARNFWIRVGGHKGQGRKGLDKAKGMTTFTMWWRI